MDCKYRYYLGLFINCSLTVAFRKKFVLKNVLS